MEKLRDALQCASTEGRREFLDEIFRAIADLTGALEKELVECREKLDRAIWLHSISSEEDEGWIEICTDAVKDAEERLTDFHSFLWDFNIKPWHWVGEYRDARFLVEAAQSRRPDVAREPPPSQTPPRRKKMGRPAAALEKTITRMNADLDGGGAGAEVALRGEAITKVAAVYKVHHTVASAARKQVLNDRAKAQGDAGGNSVVEFPQTGSAKNTAA